MSSTVFVAMLTVGTMAAGAQDLRDQVRKHGAVEVLLVKEYPPVDLPTLVRDAELIARVLIVGSDASLAGDRISTEYRAQVLGVVKGAHEIEGRVITVKRPGGKLSLEGGTATARDPDFPAFELGEEFVLFLKRTTEARFEVPFGAQGAFKVDQGKVVQVSRDVGTWNRERGPVPLPEMLKEIASATKKE